MDATIFGFRTIHFLDSSSFFSIGTPIFAKSDCVLSRQAVIWKSGNLGKVMNKIDEINFLIAMKIMKMRFLHGDQIKIATFL